ncbi:16S rRNA (guanine(966)-N(2))-methyltransferase RsmD [uncultured Clostridium sp.]|uniref:16S rRNA (guanine(966)-N(2))-methyltransferase RsmD n=1 Tax=uncultured Clostridium sp. TaxID=59620 RepID=UPI0026286162|nr:16S rRNA (guanine(966)-N(2))-methyltransferase RsmD [uncultured Clostridium sp.]
MRIIAGKARGRKILSPETYETRPTLDRVKEAMFSIIQGYIPNAVVVDVFSGTGSLGLEAASRGAKEVHLIDKSPQTYPILKKNVENLKFKDCCFTYNMDSYAVLKMLAKKNKVFNLIFIDPPYCREMIPEALKTIYENNMLDEDGIIVTKIDSMEEIYEGYKNLVLVRNKKYGNTTVCFYKYDEVEE